MNCKVITNQLKNLITGKKILTLSLAFLSFSLVNAGDDVYDAPQPREVKVKAKQTYTAPVEQTEKTVPYTEDENSSSTRKPSGYTNEGGNYSNDNYSNNNYSNDGWDYSYSDRIRRFHNPSIQFSYGYSSFNNPFYDPWNSYNSFNSYYFTPSWAYSYNNFYNPFWGCSQVVIINDPWMNMGSCYNPGFYNPYSSWNYYSPSCASIIYNNTYPYYNGYYDAGRKNVVYAPRTGGYNNSNRTGYSNSNYNSNTPNTGVRNNTSYPSGRQPNTNTNTTPPNTYRYNNRSTTPAPASTPSNNWNTHNGQNSAPVNNGNSNEGGIRIGTKPK